MRIRIACLMVTAVALPTAVRPQGAEPRRVVRAAIAAVEGDSVARVRARWARAGDRASTLGLATLARLTYDFGAADSLYGTLLRARHDGVSVQALLGRAVSARSRGALLEAERMADSAARSAIAIGDSGTTAEALILLAATRARTAGPAAAESTFQRARLLPLDPALQAQWHCSRAEMLALSFRPASTEAMAGAGLAQEAGDRRVRAHCLHLLAADSARRGWVPEAVALFGEVAALRRSLRDRTGLASTLQWRGAQQRVQGFLDAAWRDFHEAVTEGRASGNASAMAWSFAGLQSIESQLGDVAASSAYGDSAAALFAKQGDRYGQALALEGRALQSLLARDFARARDEYTRAAELYESLGFGQGMYTARLGLVSIGLVTGALDVAGREVEIARAAARRFGQQAFLNGLTFYDGLLALRRGRLDEAERAFTRQLATVHAEMRANPSGAQPNWEYYDKMRLAQVRALRDDVARAGALAIEASEALDRWRATLSRKELRLFALQLTETIHDTDMGLSTVVARLVDANHVDTAFALVERLHARELLDRLARADGMRNGRDTAASTGAHLAQVIPTADIRSALPDDSTAIVEYLLGRNGASSTVFVLTRRSLLGRTMPSSERLASDIERFAAIIEGGGQPKELARQLSREVLDPALELLPPGVNRLLVVPDGALHRLAFDALVMPNGRYAVQRFAIATLPSGSIAARLRRQPPRSMATRILAVGDPMTAPTVRQAGVERGGPRASDVAGARAQAAALQNLPRLRASAGEARSVARYGQGSVTLLGANAAEARIKRLPLSSFRVLHFATHARADEATLSGTALALAPGDGDDGLLGPGELAALDLQADLVTLSACRTAGGTVVRGEGIVGLAAPLIEAGARAVALTRWPIGDKSTPTFVADFYNALAAGLSAGDAMRDAKLRALERGAPPAQWAAFTLLGDPTVIVPLERMRRPIGVYVWIVAAVVVLALAIFAKSRVAWVARGPKD